MRLPPGQDAVRSSRVLDNKLLGPARRRLSDAVETIQPEQYRQIAESRQPVLIVQGAAGSGKSLVGLHRIDFFLSPQSDIGSIDRPTAERVIMFGPSPAFLDYVSGLLPGLGVRRIRQMTVSEWLLGQFSSRVTIGSRDNIFDALMNNYRKLTEAEIGAHLFKTGPKMKRLIDSYAVQLRKAIRARIGRRVGLSIPGPSSMSPSIELRPAALRSRVADVLGSHAEPNRAREFLVNSLAEDWVRLHPRLNVPRSESLANARRFVERSLTPLWPRIDFRREYVNLVSSADAIMRYARKGDVDASGAEAISRTAPRGAGQALGLTDLAAALYLDYAINGFKSELLQHVVVDEAQDVSPLEIILMQMHSTKGSFTILGDLRQSVLAYKSIENWNQVAGLFERETVSRLDSRLTYRSTKQITQYANRILQGLPERTKTPIPYSRSGERPRLVRSKSAAEMEKMIADSVRRLTGLADVRTVAVLTKWKQNADKISDALERERIEGVSVLTTDGLAETDVIASPIILTKGLEFDAVIVANAHKGNFNETDFDRMLLYLACTRAKHYLEIHWHGTRSPIVPGVARLAASKLPRERAGLADDA